MLPAYPQIVYDVSTFDEHRNLGHGKFCHFHFVKLSLQAPHVIKSDQHNW